MQGFAYFVTLYVCFSRRPFAVLHRQYSEMVESLTNQIINYQKHIIATVILQDAESHNWADQRPFFEVSGAIWEVCVHC